MIDREIQRRERELSRLEIDDQIADRRRSIADKRRLEAEAKRAYGRDWKKMLYGAAKGLKPNVDAIHTLYASNPDLREASVPRMRRH